MFPKSAASSKSKSKSVKVKSMPNLRPKSKSIDPNSRQSRMAMKKILGFAESFSEKIHFTSEECHSLAILHYRLSGGGKLDRVRFRHFLMSTFDITDDIMLDLIFKSFDRNNDGDVDLREFVSGLSIMLRGNLDELMEFCYFTYDMNGDHSLSREEFYHCLKGCINPGYGIDDDEVDDAEREIVDLVLKKLDNDKDSQVTYKDFRASVQKNPLLLQVIGPCLPSSNAMATFLSTFVWNYRAHAGTLIEEKDTLSRLKSKASLLGTLSKKSLWKVSLAGMVID